MKEKREREPEGRSPHRPAARRAPDLGIMISTSFDIIALNQSSFQIHCYMHVTHRHVGFAASKKGGGSRERERGKERIFRRSERVSIFP